MLGVFKNDFLLRLLCGLMGLYLLNISVDSADPYSNNVPENLSINDQESIIEIIIEKILGFENAIKEYDDCDSEDHHKKNFNKIDFSTLQPSSKLFYLIFDSRKYLFPFYRNMLSKGYLKLSTPPPKPDLF